MTYNPALADAFRKIGVSQPAYPGDPAVTLVEAEQVGDTLTIAAGFGITITADPATDRIVISNTGNGTGAYTEITDVNADAVYYPLFSRPFQPTDINPLDTPPSYQLDTIFVDNTTTPMTYNPSTGRLALQEIQFADGTVQTTSAAVTVSSTPPTSAYEGDVWMDSTTGIQYVYYVDVDSGQWVQPTNVGYGNQSGQAYTLPVATTVDLGGIRADGTSIVVDMAGVISVGAVDWANLTNIPSLQNYTLPAAGVGIGGTLGGVRIDGTTITIAGGVISASAVSYALPAATGLTLGGIKVGAGLTITGSGVLSVEEQSQGGDVAGPSTASDNAVVRFDQTTGKIIQNSLVTITDAGAIIAPASTSNVLAFYYANQAAFPTASTNPGLMAHSQADGKMYFSHNNVWKALANVTDVPLAYTLPTANTVQIGGVRIDGTSITIASGTISATPYSLPTAASNTLGGIKVGTGLNIDGSGSLSVNASSTEALGTIVGATGVVTHNYNTAVNWFHNVPLADFTVALTNIPTANDNVVKVVLYVAQGVAAYVPGALSINGILQTILWANGNIPTGTDEGFDKFEFTLLRSASVWTVIGQVPSAFSNPGYNPPVANALEELPKARTISNKSFFEQYYEPIILGGTFELPQASTISNSAFFNQYYEVIVNAPDFELPQASTVSNNEFFDTYIEPIVGAPEFELPQASTVSNKDFFDQYYEPIASTPVFELPQASVVSNNAFFNQFYEPIVNSPVTLILPKADVTSYTP
jgi:hypothetical protein